jgi:hypothetical protein
MPFQGKCGALYPTNSRICRFHYNNPKVAHPEHEEVDQYLALKLNAW